MDKPLINKIMKKGIVIILSTIFLISFVLTLSLNYIPWKIIGIITIFFTIFVGIILVISYFKYNWIKKHNKKIIIIIIVCFILSQLLNFGANILENKEKIDDIEKKFDLELTNANRVVFFNNTLNNKSIYKESESFMFKPLFRGNYKESVIFIDNKFNKIGITNNTFKVEKIKDGYGIIFSSRIPDNETFMYYCDDFNDLINENNFSLYCRFPRVNESTLLLGTNFRVVNNTLEGRYFKN